MILTKLLITRLTGRLYRAPVPGDDGAGGGGDEKVDRGDDFTPTGEDAPENKPAAEPKKDEKPLPKDKKGALKELSGEDDPEKGEGDPEQDPEDPKNKKKDTRIPLKRHQELLNKERERREAAENALKGFKGQEQVVKTNEEITVRENKVVDLEKDYAKALTDGEHAKAAEIMGKIRKLEREIVTLESDAKVAAAEARAIETARYRVTLERIEEAYPVLNEDSPEFDEDVYKEVVDLANAYVAGGRSPSDALQRAVKKELGGETYAQRQATEVKPRVDKEDVQAATRAARAKEGTDKTLKATEKSPATAVAKAGLNSNERGAERTAKDVIKMSQADFAKIDEKELARLRGDILEGAE